MKYSKPLTPGQMLGENMGSFQTEINKARTDLESSSLDTSSTAEAVQFVTYVQQLKRNMRQWQEQVEVGHNTTDKQTDRHC